MSEVDTLIARLNLVPHPEGGWYRQTWVAPSAADARPAGTAIYYLLRAGERSAWHRIDADEIWHHYAGAPLVLRIAADWRTGGEALHLGPDVLSGEAPQALVPAGAWQSAESTGEWTLTGCTVSPGFRFEGFELADPPGP